MKTRSYFLLGLALSVLLLLMRTGLWMYRQQRQDVRNQQLIAALVHNDTRRALALINAGADPNGYAPAPVSLMPFLNRMLHMPAHNMKANVAPLLLTVQVPLSTETDNSHILFDENEEEHTEEATQLVAVLLAKGARSNEEDENGKTPLMWAAAAGRNAIVIQLLAHGAAVNKQDKAGWTALHYAVYEANSEAVRLLLNHQADPNLRDTDGFTPLDIAVHIHHYKPVQIMEMLTRAEAQEKDKARSTPAFQAQLNGDLLMALEAGQDTRMATLLKRGADANTPVNSYGRTALMQAAGWGGEEEITLLARWSAKVDAQDEDGETALMYAIQKGRDENVRALLTCHANLTLHTKDGRTALRVAQECLTCNASTPFLHIEAGERRKFWRQMARMLRGDTQPVERHLRPLEKRQ